MAHINQKENAINRNVEDVITIESDRMETDENCYDGDSGFENMETDECAPVRPIDDVVVTEKESIDERTICISRILDAFWDDCCEGKIIVSETAFNRSEDSSGSGIDYEDLSSQILVEIAMQYFDGKLIDLKDLPETDKLTPSTSDVSDCPVPMMRPFNAANIAILKYFIGAYSRCEQETLKYSDAKFIKKFDNAVLNVISNVKLQIIRYTIQLVTDKMRLSSTDSIKTYEKSPLVKLLLRNEIPPDFLRSIVSEAAKAPADFNIFFNELVNILNIYMQCKRMPGSKLCVAPIIALNELVNVTLIDEPNVRPICNLIAKKSNFYPTLTTDFQGREITRTSYLGPFLSISVFSEENPLILDDDLKQDIENVSLNTTERLRSVSIYLLASIFSFHMTLKLFS